MADERTPFPLGTKVVNPNNPGREPLEVRSYITPGFDMVVGYPGYPAGFLVDRADVGNYQPVS